MKNINFTIGENVINNKERSMLKIIIILLISTFTLNAQTYCAGDQVSIEHQNAAHPVGAAYDDYVVGDDFYLSDWNGALNGGEYHVIFIDMSASW